jgi:hypothetical protein
LGDGILDAVPHVQALRILSGGTAEPLVIH